ncbi:MAG: 50S ribosomal protein L18 [Gemmatimonadota bacterium]
MAKSKAEMRRRRRARRHRGIRKKIRGTSEKPRLVVHRSLKHVEGQLVDDDRAATLIGVSTRSPAIGGQLPEGREGKVAASFAAGRLLAERAREVGVESAVFDRAGYRYHGRVKAFAEGAREGGLRF